MEQSAEILCSEYRSGEELLQSLKQGRNTEVVVLGGPLEDMDSREFLERMSRLPQKPLQPALRKQTQALAGAVSMERLLAVYDFIDVLIDRVSRNAASAAVTCALTSDIYRICYAS